MNAAFVKRLAAGLGLVALLVFVSAGHAPGQTPSLPPYSGSAYLNAGFLPDPYIVNVTAGGSVYTTLGGVATWVSNAPDFKLYYGAGGYPLSFNVDSRAATSLLVNLPDGTWVASGSFIRFPYPPSGRYDIWVGTLYGGYAPATLRISERL